MNAQSLAKTLKTGATLYHGGSHIAPAWFSTDADHAGYFGEVREYHLQADRVRIVTAEESAGMGDGYEADAALAALLPGYDAIVVEGWEGAGLCVFAPDLVQGEQPEDEDDLSAYDMGIELVF